MRIESIKQLVETEIQGFLVGQILTKARNLLDAGFSILENDFLYEVNKNVIVHEDGSMTLVNMIGKEITVFPLYAGRCLHYRITLEQIAGMRGGLAITAASLAQMALDGPHYS